MFNELFEKLEELMKIESKLLSLLEGKTWEQIALAFYQILDDIDTADDMCKENTEAFRNMVMKLQAKKNQYLHSPDGYTIEPVVEIDECVCHIYEMDDDKLLEFYRNMDRSYRKVDGTRMETYVPDKREVEQEIEKRGLEIPVNENLTGHARRELELAGMLDKEVDGSEAAGSWNILCVEAVIELMEVFAKQGHSGFSASMTQDLFSRLAKFEALSELTDDPDEWNDISEMQSGKPGWQSQRSPSCFSEDGGKTYWDINEEYYIREDEDGERYSGGLTEEEWANRPMHSSKHVGKRNNK